MAIQERYGPEGVFSEVYEGRSVSHQKVHQEIIFNMGKMEGLMNLLTPNVRQAAELKARYKADRARFVERQLGAKVAKTRADVLADAHFAETLLAIAQLDAEIELYKLAMAMRKTNLEAFRTLASDVRSYAG